MPYAGTTSLLSFKYSFLIDTVKKLKRRSISASDIYLYFYYEFINKFETSETLRNEIAVVTEKVKPLSFHVPTHLKPNSDRDFGHYLAGLIDGDGHFSSKQQLVIVFHSLDVSLAYFLKKHLGYGSIRKVKDKNAFILIIASRKGIEKVINLIK